MTMTRHDRELWWKAEPGKVHTQAFKTARQFETELGDVFDRFVKLEALYDPNTPDADGETGHVTENVIATGVDTVHGIVATADIRARWLLDDADWGQTRRARHLEFYAEERQVDLKILAKCRRGFKEAVKKGMGITKSSTRFGRPRVELVAIENLVVDPAECRDGREPRQLHQWDSVDADELIAMFPDLEEEIDRARGRGNSEWMRAAGRYSMPANQVIVLWSWRLPIGTKGLPGYKPGRAAMCIDGLDLADEKYEEDEFPFGMMSWSERLKSFYPISGSERIMGIQRALNKRNWQTEKILDQNAVMTTYMRPADVAAPVKTTKWGNWVMIKGDWPHTPTPPAVHPEIYQDRIRLRASGIEELGVNQMSAHAAKPAGVESGVAIRELHDVTTQRFAPQEQAFEQFVLDTIYWSLVQCKKLGKKAPKMIRRGRFGQRQINWEKTDLLEMRLQMRAASNTTRQPWGRAQTVIELAQAGIVGTDSARRMLANLDIDQELSGYMAALEAIEGDFDDIADGFVVTFEPLQNAAMAVWRGTNEYNKWLRRPGVPEESLEVLRSYIAVAADIVAKSTAPANENTLPADPLAAAMPPGPPMPGAGQPTAALADQAMNLTAA